MLAIIEAKSIFIEKIKSKQFKDGDLDDVRINIATDKSQGTNLDANVLHNYKGRIYVQRDDDLIQRWLTLFYNTWCMQEAYYPLMTCYP